VKDGEKRGKRQAIYFEDILYCVVSRIGFAHIEQIPFLYAQPMQQETRDQRKTNVKQVTVQTYPDNT